MEMSWCSIVAFTSEGGRIFRTSRNTNLGFRNISPNDVTVFMLSDTVMNTNTPEISDSREEIVENFIKIYVPRLKKKCDKY